MMTLLFMTMAGLLAIGVPIAFTLGLASAVFYLTAPGISPAFLVQRMVSATESVPLLAVPFFIFAGAVMTRGGISHRILGLASPTAPSMASAGWCSRVTSTAPTDSRSASRPDTWASTHVRRCRPTPRSAVSSTAASAARAAAMA